ncbi:MAG: cytochrome c-550 PedF [Marinospirillum sp.]|uniref:cytochrome c-550 PedF n=1 Tax=Marinospirillum sp. TaxID=2183934 RepID=UPI0019E7D0CA|nr:cytochrome c-550 PedF [Marinospirillum sp.]MBE0505638.1 cytochrome c-550 PedF [Marinospirillum sp.]
MSLQIKNSGLLSVAAVALVSGLIVSGLVLAHGDVTPQPVETKGLTPLGDDWLEENPYQPEHNEYEVAVKIGASAYNQNCARCHGLEAISGGIAPDLREMENGIEGDEWFIYRVREGAVRDGRVYMPRMADYMDQEAVWAIRAWLETVSHDR